MSKRNDTQRHIVQLRRRTWFAMSVFLLAGLGLVARAVQLQVLDDGFLAGQGDARHLRVAQISAHRGSITDRNGQPLAVSTPVDSVWANPVELAEASERLVELAAALEMDHERLLRTLARAPGSTYEYLRRHVSPAVGARVRALGLPGVHLLREYRRYYPAGEVAGHVLGFTDVDDIGQEGLELAFDPWLAGKPGSKEVLRDRRGQTVENVRSIEPPSPGKTLVTSIDLRIQYLAYRALKSAVQQHRARSGSVVVLDVLTGEVLAIASQPGYNPNDRGQFRAARYRNRAVTDIFEPGSSFKTITMAAALESGQYGPLSPIDTSPGHITVGPKLIEDSTNLGMVDATTVLVRSSNVGITKIALSMDAEYLWTVLTRFGFGQLTGSGFPGESAGLVPRHTHWRPIGQATLSYGYGLSVTPLQLAQAYATVGAGGTRVPVSFLRIDEPPRAERVIGAGTAADLVGMLEQVVAPGGTGMLALVPGYRVAGKTGTARKAEAGGYSLEHYVAVFAGLAPASEPRLAAVVLIDEPSAGAYYGGKVAAPVFSEVIAGALRVLAVSPDAPVRSSPSEIIQARAEMLVPEQGLP